MAEKYDEMNNQLFGGRLMECGFEVFTKGAGMEGSVLGWFCITGRNIKVKRNNRRIFKDTGWNEVYVSRDNFVEICKPVIKLNGNYHGTEHSFLATLVHEMCHYYTYMNGYAPVQSHGREFKEIGAIVSSRSKGMFSIQRLATAEDMNEMSLNADMKAKRAKRLANKKASVSAILVFAKNGEVKLTISSNTGLIQTIEETEKKRGENVLVSNNAEVIDFLFNKGYKKNMRSWRYWSLEGKPWLDELKQLFGTSNNDKEEKPEPKPKITKKIFSIRTTNGVFEIDCTSLTREELANKLQERFPNMKYEVINKIIGNSSNFKEIKENKLSFSSIVESVINELMYNNDTVDITPDMNLGIKSPIEGEV